MFSRFAGKINESRGTPVFWGRADVDGAPFRGSIPPLLREGEAEALLERSYDVYYGTFDTSNPEQKHFDHTLADILERYGNGWYTITTWNERWHESKNKPPVMYVFVVWRVPIMEQKQQYSGGNNGSRIMY